MKERILKAGRVLLPMLLTAMMQVSCVEDEHAPFTDDSVADGSTINVMLPSYGEFYTGSVVTLRGTGFTAGDRVLVQNGTNESGQPGYSEDLDYNGDGVADVLTEVEATVLNYGDTYLDFVIPGEIVWSNATVYVVRNGVKYFIGYIQLYNYSCNTTWQSDGLTTFTVEGMDLSDVDRIFLRSMSFDNEGGITVSTVEQEADIRIYDDYMIESAAYILGEAQVYLERNGEEFYVGQVSAPPYSCLSYPASDTYSPGETLTIGGQCFIQGDRVLLYGGNENQDYHYAETTVTADGITFVVPDSGDAGLVIYDVLIERGGVYISLDWNFMAEMDRI